MPLSATAAPSIKRQLASPVGFQLAMLLPSKSVTHLPFAWARRLDEYGRSARAITSSDSSSGAAAKGMMRSSILVFVWRFISGPPASRNLQSSRAKVWRIFIPHVGYKREQLRCRLEGG